MADSLILQSCNDGLTSIESRSRFEDILYRSPGAKRFFNLSDNMTGSSLVSSFKESCERRPFLSPVSVVLKQMGRPARCSLTVNEEKSLSSSPLSPPRAKSAFQKPPTSPQVWESVRDVQKFSGHQIIDEEENRLTLEQSVTNWPNGKNLIETPQNNDMSDLIPETIMDSWYLSQPRKRILVIEGHRVGDPEDEMWHSSAISHRITPRVLVTLSGCKYRLRGHMNIEMTLENGFSPEVVKKFLKGFPSDWKEIMQEHCTKKEQFTSKQVAKDNANGSFKATSVIKQRSSKRIKSAKSTPITDGMQPSKGNTSEPDSKKSNLLTSKIYRQCPKDYMKTSTGYSTPRVISLDELTCTRSGRRVVPPLAFWTGQRQRNNRRLDEVEIIAGSEDHTNNSINTPKLIGLKTDSEDSLAQSSISSRLRSGRAKEVVTEGDSRIRKGSRRSMETAAKRKQEKSEKKAIGDEPSQKKKNQEKNREMVIKKPTVKRKQLKKESECKEQDVRDRGYCTKKGTRRIPKQNQVTEVDHGTRNSGMRTGRNVPQMKTSDNEKQVQPIRKRQVKGKGAFEGNMKETPTESVPYKKSGNHSEVLEQSSDTESMKQETNQIRAAPLRENESVNFDLYGDILGILAKQKQQREEKKSHRKASSDSSQNISPEMTHDIDGRFGIDIREDGIPSKMKDIPSLPSGDHDKYFIQRTSVSRGKKLFNGERSLSGSFQIPLSQQDEEETDNEASKGKRNVAIGQASDTKDSDDKSKRKTIINTLDKAETHCEVAKPKSSRDRGRRTAEKENKRGSGEWTQDEVQRLESAMQGISKKGENYWQRISDKVGTRQAEDCKARHQLLLKEGKILTNKRKPVKEPKQGAITIDAKKGTLRRKRQLRELAEHHNMDFEEDLFDATPYKKTKKNKIPLCNGSDEESEDGFHASKTPSLRMPSIAPFSTKKTPHSHWTPGLLQSINRDNAEQYIYRMQKRKTTASRQKATPLAGKPSVKFGTKQSKFQDRFNKRELQQAFEVKEITGEDDSDEEKDYYWSEEEEGD